MADTELETMVALAKSDTATAKPKSFWYSEIRKHANWRRQPGQSIEQAVAKFIADPDGRPLFRAMNKAKGPALAAPEEPDADSGESEGLKKLRAIAAQLKAENPELSKQQALSKAIQTPAGSAAFLEDKKYQLGAG